MKMICRLLGVPTEDEPKFHVWADNMVKSVGAADQENSEELLQLMRRRPGHALRLPLELVAEHRRHPNASGLGPRQ